MCAVFRLEKRPTVSFLASEAVESSTLTLQGVDDVHGGHGLPLGVLGVRDGVSDDVLKENLEDAPGLLVDEAGDTLDATSTSQTPDGRLGDSLDVVSQNFTMALGSTLSKTLSSFSSTRHDDDDGNQTIKMNRRRRRELLQPARVKYAMCSRRQVSAFL